MKKRDAPLHRLTPFWPVWLRAQSLENLHSYSGLVTTLRRLCFLKIKARRYLRFHGKAVFTLSIGLTMSESILWTRSGTIERCIVWQFRKLPRSPRLSFHCLAPKFDVVSNRAQMR